MIHPKEEKINESSEGKGLLSQMLEVCLSPSENSTRRKYLQKICQLLVNQVQAQQVAKITLNFRHVAGNFNDSFIIKCLLFILLRKRSLRIEFAIGSSNNKDDKSIDLKVDKFHARDISNEFISNLQAFRRRKSLYEIDHFFKLFAVTYKDLTTEIADDSYNVIRVSYDMHFFIAQFLESFNNLFQKKVYFLQTSLKSLVDEQSFASSDEKSYGKAIYSRMISQFQKLYTLNEYISGTKNNFLKDRLYQDKLLYQKLEASETSEQMLGYFKEFRGTRTQFLENLYITFSGTEEELHTISQFLRLTPNLASLKLKAKQERTFHNINYLLESMIAHTPLLKIFSFQKATISQLPNQLLLRLYEQCPFLVEFEIKLNFMFSVSETFQFNGPQDRQKKERQRQAQIILEALRLRNLTLSHSQQMIQILLKKGFTFIAALEIADCIETVCI